MKKSILILLFAFVVFNSYCSTITMMGRKTGGAQNGRTAICDPNYPAETCATFVVLDGKSTTITRTIYDATPISITGGTVEHRNAGGTLLWSGTGSTITASAIGSYIEYIINL